MTSKPASARFSRLGSLALAPGLAVLALVHPTPGLIDPIATIAAAEALWLGVHVALALGFAGLAWLLLRSADCWPADMWRTALRIVLLAFGVLSTVYVGIDGVLVGALAVADAARAETVWSAPALVGVANLVGGLWAAGLTLLAWARLPASRQSVIVGATLLATWLTFVASGLPNGVAVPPLLSRLVATASAAVIVFRGGTGDLSPALLTVAAVFRLHVGPDAAVGLVLVAAAEALSRGRSDPGAASRLSAG